MDWDWRPFNASCPDWKEKSASDPARNTATNFSLNCLLHPNQKSHESADCKCKRPAVVIRCGDLLMKILHADDHSLFREGLGFFLKLLDAQVVALEASNLQSTLDKLSLEWPVHLLLLDLEMPGMSGLEGFYTIRRRYPKLPVAIVSGVNDARIIRELIDGGARGYIPKGAKSEQLMDALRRILEGEIYLPDALFISASGTAAAGATSALTSRQQQILPLLAEGMPNKKIADLLGVTEGTIKQHLKDLFRRLQADNRTQAVKQAQRLGLLRK
jgi:DNA-binding NarL/FixJ family response regulator